VKASASFIVIHEISYCGKIAEESDTSTQKVSPRNSTRTVIADQACSMALATSSLATIAAS
jgi:hypothetical protein